MTRPRYTVTAVRGLMVTDFGTRTRPASVIGLAEHFILDRGADRIYIYAPGEGAAIAVYDNHHWQLVRDDRLRAVIESEDR